MSDKPHREVITIHGATVTLEQAVAPVAILGRDMFKKERIIRF